MCVSALLKKGLLNLVDEVLALLRYVGLLFL